MSIPVLKLSKAILNFPAACLCLKSKGSSPRPDALFESFRSPGVREYYNSLLEKYSSGCLIFAGYLGIGDPLSPYISMNYNPGGLLLIVRASVQQVGFIGKRLQLLKKSIPFYQGCLTIPFSEGLQAELQYNLFLKLKKQTNPKGYLPCFFVVSNKDCGSIVSPYSFKPGPFVPLDTIGSPGVGGGYYRLVEIKSVFELE